MQAVSSWGTFILFFLLSQLNPLFSQEAPPDKMWLRSGQVLEGKLILPDRGDLVGIILASSGDTVQILQKDIDHVERRVIWTPDELKPATSSQLPKRFNQKRIYSMLHGVGGSGDHGILGAGLCAGYRWDSGIETGLSAHYYSLTNWGNGIVPVGLDARLPISWSKTGRFVSLFQLTTGLGFSHSRESFHPDHNTITHKGTGFFIQPGLAFRMNITRQLGMIFDLCYMSSRLPIVESSSQNTLDWESKHYILSRFGILF